MIYSMPKFGGSSLTWTVLGVAIIIGSLMAVVIDVISGKDKKEAA